MAMTTKGFSHIGVQRGIAQNRPTLLGHRLEPKQVVEAGEPEEAIREFGITYEQAIECYRFVQENNETKTTSNS